MFGLHCGLQYIIAVHNIVPLAHCKSNKINKNRNKVGILAFTHKMFLLNYYGVSVTWAVLKISIEFYMCRG